MEGNSLDDCGGSIFGLAIWLGGEGWHGDGNGGERGGQKETRQVSYSVEIKRERLLPSWRSDKIADSCFTFCSWMR